MPSPRVPSTLLLAALLAACASSSPPRGLGAGPRPPIPDFTVREGEAVPPQEPPKDPAAPAPAPPAQEPPGAASPAPSGGLYAGFALLHGFEDFDTQGSAGNSDLGFGIRVGSRVQERLALEGFLEFAEGFDIGSGPADGEVDLVSLGAQGKYYLGTDPVRAYLLGGAGFVHADVSGSSDESGVFLRAGLGGEIPVGRNLAAFAELRYDEVVGGAHRFDHADLLLGMTLDF